MRDKLIERHPDNPGIVPLLHKDKSIYHPPQGARGLPRVHGAKFPGLDTLLNHRLNAVQDGQGCHNDDPADPGSALPDLLELIVIDQGNKPVILGILAIKVQVACRRGGEFLPGRRVSAGKTLKYNVG